MYASKHSVRSMKNTFHRIILMFINWSNQSQSVLVRSLEHTALIYRKCIRTIAFIHIMHSITLAHTQSDPTNTHFHTRSRCSICACRYASTIIRDFPSRAVCQTEINQTSKDLKVNHFAFVSTGHRNNRHCIAIFNSLPMQRDRKIQKKFVNHRIQ